MVEGFGEGKDVSIMRRNDLVDVSRAVVVKEGTNVKGVDSESGAGWTRVWLNVSR